MAFEAQLTADRKDCISVGQQLLANKNVHPSAAARKALPVGDDRVPECPADPFRPAKAQMIQGR